MMAAPAPDSRSRATRWAWIAGGTLALALGLIGIIVPLLPTAPFVLVAAWCFSRGCRRCEHWMLAHPRLGPVIRNWRSHRAVPLRAKQLAVVMMAISSTAAWFLLPRAWAWVPAACCMAVAVWLWTLPTSAGVAGAPGDDPPK